MLALVTITGFTESLRHPTGTEDLHRHILRPLASPSVQVLTPIPWDHDVAGLAHYLARAHITSAAVVAYSWGAGFAAPRFAKTCRQLGIQIPLMLLCDPVYRPQWLPAWLGPAPLAIRALLPGSATITIPPGVSEVHSVRQTLDLPRAHPLRAASPSTTIHPPITLPFGHTVIDEAPAWKNLVRTQLNLHLATLQAP